VSFCARRRERSEIMTLYEKSVSNIKEVKARDGIVISVVCTGDRLAREASDHLIEIPSARNYFPHPGNHTAAALAYHIACAAAAT